MKDPYLSSLTAEQQERYILALSPEVYFIRCGQFVKIGVSKNPHTRLKQVRKANGGFAFPAGLDIEKSRLIATELGSFQRERELHAKFSHLRHTGEWFTETPELTSYITALKGQIAA